MRIAYARVSTMDQSLDLQIDALEKCGYDKLFTDHGVSGVSPNRPGLEEAFSHLNEGDTLVVWRLDRLARSMYELADFLHTFKQKGVAFESICDGMDTSTALGECLYMMAGVFAHLERCILIERTREGMAAAKARGVKFGRKPALDGETFKEARFLMKEGMSVPKTARHIGVGRSTLYRYLKPLTDRARVNTSSVS